MGLSALLRVRLSIVLSCDPVGFLWTLGIFFYVFYCDEWPSEVISSADGLEACCLCRESCGGMEVPDDRFDARQFLHVVDGLAWSIGCHYGLYMIDDVVGCWDFI